MMDARRRPSLRSRLMRSVIRRYKDTSPIAATVERLASQEVDGRPAPTPHGPSLRGITVERLLIADTTVYRLRSSRTPPSRAVLYWHGGGYIEDTSIGTWRLGAQFVRETDAEVWIPAYRLAPRQTADTTVQTAAAIYRSLLSRWPSKAVTIAGDSAGGGLALAMTQAALAAGDPAPALLGLFAPWVDLTMSDPAEEAFDDPMLDHARLTDSAKAYAGNLPLTDPRVSPIHGTLEGLPPTCIIVGDDDMLVHQNRRLRDLMAAQSLPVTYIEDPHMMHCHIMMPIPEARKSLSRFITDLKALI